MYRLLTVTVLMVVVFAACKKQEDAIGASDERLNANTYCNDPLAVNYNWGFPGQPDNTKCFYPTEIFKGTFSYNDSTYDVNYQLTGVRNVTLNVTADGYTKLYINGFCGTGSSLPFTADRFFKATADTTIYIDSVKNGGQPLCRAVDTLSGYIIRDRDNDTAIRINFTVHSDTGISYHMGTAIKQ